MAKEPAKESPPKELPKQYICIAPCFHQGHLYQIGQRAVFLPGEHPKDKKGNLRHFEPVVSEKPAAAAKSEEE